MKVAEVLTARFDLPADSRAAGRARRLITQLLASWGRPEDSEVAQLLVSEVVTNAVRHAGRGQALEIRVTADDVRVRIAVGDGSTLRPVPRAPRDDEESGRGMRLVAALASEWGVIDRPLESGPGKQVWFELPPVAASARPAVAAAAPFGSSVPLLPPEPRDSLPTAAAHPFAGDPQGIASGLGPGEMDLPAGSGPPGSVHGGPGGEPAAAEGCAGIPGC